ncbi:MAG TPA: AsmA family protein, partial [Albitalea sp.]
MSVWIRRGLWGLLALLVVLAALATWLVASFDPNRFKGTAVEWMKVHRNRTLVMDGPIELSVFPRLQVKLSKVRLSEPGRPDLFAALEEAGLAVDVLPLLRGELVVGRVAARGVRVTYLRDAQGRSNLDDLLKRDAPKPAEAEKAGGQALRFDVSGIDVADLRARIKDDAAQVDGDVLVQSFTAGRLADGATSPLALAARFEFRQPAVKGELAGDTKLSLDADTSSAALRDMDLRFKGDVPGASAVDAEIAGSLAWDGARRSVDAKALTLRFAGNAAGMKLADSRVAIEHFAFDPASKALDLRKLQARIQGTQAGQPLAVELDWPELSVAGERLGGSGFSGKASRGGTLPLEITYRSGAPTGNFDALRLPGYVAQWSSNAPQRKMEGTLRADLTLKPAEPSLTFERLDLQARLDEPKLPPYAIAARGTAIASTKRSSWNLQGQLNQATFATEGTATLAGVTPQVNAKARFDALDLNRLLGPPAPAAPKGEGPAAADTPVDLAGLRVLDGQLSLRAGRFVYRQYRIDEAAIDASLQGGMLRVTQLQGRAWGGQVNATAFADARASRVAVKGAANGVDVNALVRDLASKDLLEGAGRVALDLDTAGRSVNEMKSRLKGSAALHVRDGAIK